MNIDDYQFLANRTAKQGDEKHDLIHAALGLTGEAGEFADVVKKHTIYDQELNREHAIEEVGDLLWYVALACETLGVRMSDVARGNIDKLQRRYPEKFTVEHAAARLDKTA